MSLEAALAELTAAVKEQTALMQALSKGAKADTTKAEPKAETPRAAPKAEPKGKAAGKGKKAPTPESVTLAFGDFLKSATDRAERGRLVGVVKPILAHFGIERVSEIDSENCEEAMGYLEELSAAYSEGGADAVEEVKLSFMGDDGDADDDDIV